MAEQLIKITVDNIAVEVPAGTTILQAARKIGGEVTPPAMCYYSKLEGSGGKCRTCLVEVSKGSEKDPRPMPKLVPSCRTTVMEGMEVKNITSPRVKTNRDSIVEMLLINHPLDCPVCDQAGECHLQDLSFEHGGSASRYDFPKRTFEKQDLGDYIQLHMNRCILCYRCVFAAEQLTGEREHGVLGRGDHAEIATCIQKNLHSDMIGNVIDVCPVGALTDKTFRFKNRVWFLKPMDAHRNCTNPKCAGKVTLWNRGDDVLRVTAQKDEWGEVKDWICNECRFEKKKLSEWEIDGPTNINRHSVIAQGHYEKLNTPQETFSKIMHGAQPKSLMDIHDESNVNAQPLSTVKGAPTSRVYNN